MRSWSLRFLILLSVALIAAAWLWEHRRSAPRRPSHSQATVQIPPTPRPVESTEPPRPRLFVLAINGGASPGQNFKSHLLHLQGVVDLLHTAGVPEERITVLSGDGGDPAPDLVDRTVDLGPDDWRLDGTDVEEHVAAHTDGFGEHPDDLSD